MALTKVQIVNDAYSRLRISGISLDPSAEDVQIALDRLENMAWTFHDRMATGYNFEEDPDPNSAAGIPRKYMEAFATNLALKLIPDFNKAVPQALVQQARGTMSLMSNSAFTPMRTPYPSRQPVGSGNRRWLWWRQYYPSTINLTGVENTRQDKDTKQAYVFDFQSHLNGEIIDTFSFAEKRDKSGIIFENEAATDTQTGVEISFQNQVAGQTFQVVARVVTPTSLSYEIEVLVITF